MQEVVIGDSSAITKCSLWEDDIDSLSIGCSYVLKNFDVHEFASKKYITKMVGCDIIPVSNIGVIAVKPDEVDNGEINNVQIVAIPQLTCMCSKARVESSNPPFGHCSKENCNMYLQDATICQITIHE